MTSYLVVVVVVVSSFVVCATDGQLLGGWRTSTDSALVDECLEKALVDIRNSEVDDNLRSRVSNIICQTQIVNGLNIRLTFAVGERNWRCTFYKSFNEKLTMQLEACKRVIDEPTAPTNDNGNQEIIRSSDNDAQVGQGSRVDGNIEVDGDDDNDDDDDDDEVEIDQVKKREEADQASAIPADKQNDMNEDGEAKIDAIQQQMIGDNVKIDETQ
jgi:hypothetical protein